MGENRLSQTLVAVGVVGVVTPARHLLIDFAIIDHRHKFLEGCKLFCCEIVSFHEGILEGANATVKQKNCYALQFEEKTRRPAPKSRHNLRAMRTRLQTFH